MSKIDWEKANRQGKRRRLSSYERRAKRNGEAEVARFMFVKQHGLSCFVCGFDKSERWGKTGTSKRGPWAICSVCVRRQSG